MDWRLWEVIMMPEVRLDEIFEQGRDSGRGNLLGIQPWMLPGD
jgi:hypothetical protein